MGAYEGLTQFFSADLCALAEYYEYSEENLCILEGNEQELQRSFPQTYHNILSCEHNQDNRNPIQYAKDVVASWLFEDYLVSEFDDRDRDLELAGGDRNRILLPNSSVSSSSDCVYRYNGQSLRVEVMNSYTPFWKTQQRLHLRDNKYLQLCREKGVLLCVDTQDSTFAIIDFTQVAPPARYIKSHRPYGGKPAYELSLSHVTFYCFRIQDIIDSLDGIIA